MQPPFDSPALPPILPAWVSELPLDALRAMLLAGSWEDPSSGDASQLEMLGTNREDVQRAGELLQTQPAARVVFQPLVGTPDGRWFCWEHEQETWWLLGGLLRGIDLDRFAPLLQRTLQATDESSRIRRAGVVRVLVLVGHSDFLIPCSPTPSQRASALVATLLDPTDFETWSRNQDLLPYLAEAAPSAFLDQLSKAFQSNGGALCGRITGDSPLFLSIVQSLEVLAWDTLLLERAVYLLLDLASLVRSSTFDEARPSAAMESLRGIFHPSLPQTSASTEQRLTLLEAVCASGGDLAFSLLLLLLRRTGTLHSAHRPWLAWLLLPPENNWHYEGEEYVQVEWFVNLAEQAAGRDAIRWSKLLGPLLELPTTLGTKLLRSLRKKVSSIADPNGQLWGTLDRNRTRLREIARYSQENPAASQAGAAHDNPQEPPSKDRRLVLLDELYRLMTPTDPFLRYAWRFSKDAHERILGVLDSYPRDLRLELQKEAVLEIEKDPEALGLLARLSEVADPPYSLAVTLSACSLADELDRRLRTQASFGALQRIAAAFLAVRLQPRPFEETAALLSDLVNRGRTDDAVDLALHCEVVTERGHKLWALIDQLGEPMRGDYWRRLNIHWTALHGATVEHAESAVHRLLAYDRLPIAVNAALSVNPPVGVGCRLSVLENVARHYWKERRALDAQRNKSEGEGEGDSSGSALLEVTNRPLRELDTNDVVQLLTKLQPSSPEELRRAHQVELRLVPWLGRNASERYRLRFLPAWFSEHPKALADLLEQSASRRRGQPDDEGTLSPIDIQLNLARLWRDVPGAERSPSEAGEFLLHWCREVWAHLVSDQGKELGYHVLAALLAIPMGDDGVWPGTAARRLLRELPGLKSPLSIAKQNSRGMRMRRVDELAQEEHAMAVQHHRWAESLSADGWMEAADLNRSIARSYEWEAKLHDVPHMETPMTQRTLRPLFPLRRIVIENFRGIRKLDLPPHPRLNLFFGRNATGKSTILDAIALGLAEIGRQLPKLEERIAWPRHRPSDLRLSGIGDKRQPEPSLSIDLWGQPGGGHPQALHWRVADVYSAVGSRLHPQIADRHSADFSAYLQQITESLRTNQHEVAIPVFAHYSVERASGELAKKVAVPTGGVTERVEGLNGALIGAARFEKVLLWLRVFEDVEQEQRNEKGDQSYCWPPVEAVRAAIKATLQTPDGTSCTSPRIKRKTGTCVVDFYPANSPPEPDLELAQLSDGFRTHLALVLDLAMRMVRCNPPPEADPQRDGFGTRSYAVVLIDEVDLHLHPSWQQTVLPDLARAFPNTQFFATTHSEQVLSSIDDSPTAPGSALEPDGQPQGQVFQLAYQANEVRLYSSSIPNYGARASDILTINMEVKERSPSPLTQQLRQYLLLVSDGKGSSDEALKLRAAIESKRGFDDPALIEADFENNRQAALTRRGQQP